MQVWNYTTEEQRWIKILRGMLQQLKMLGSIEDPENDDLTLLSDPLSLLQNQNEFGRNSYNRSIKLWQYHVTTS